MKKILSIIGAINLSAIWTSSVIACGYVKTKINNKPIAKKENNDDIKILEEYINNTILDNTKNSEIKILSAEIKKKWNELWKKAYEYKINFKTNKKNVDFQLFMLFSLRKEEASFKLLELKYGKKIPPEENISSTLFKELIEQIKKGFFYIEKKEYKINHLIVKLARELEKKYFL